MENKQMDSRLESKIKDAIAEKVPEPEIIEKKMGDAYKRIREMKKPVKRKSPAAVKFATAAAVLALAVIYCVKNPALAAQLPLIGNIFRQLEGQVSYPGDYSKNSITLADVPDDKKDDAGTGPSDGTEPSDSEDDAGTYEAESGGITVTLSEVSYDHDAIYLAILVQNEEGFAENAQLQDQLDFYCRTKFYKPDGSVEEFSDENGISMLGYDAEGKYVDLHTFQGIIQLTGISLDVSEYVSCDLTFCEFRQQLTTGELKTVIVPDYGKTSMMEYDWTYYPGTWNFHLDFNGFEDKKEEIAVNGVNDQGFGIEKVIKTGYEIYAVPVLPDGEEWYDYMVTIWDADGEMLEYHGSDFTKFNFYGRDISKVTVYLLKWDDFCESKGSNSYLQPSKAIYQTTVSLEDCILANTRLR